jgi:hypothetical protein
MTDQNLLPQVNLAVDTNEAADLLGLQTPTLEKDRRFGHLGIPYVRAGRRVIYPVRDLGLWLDKNRVTPKKSETGEIK